VPAFDRVVVAVDPSVSKSGRADECGIVVAGATMKGPRNAWSAVVIEDASVSGGGPQAWAEAAVAAYHRHGADRIVAEVNQGGALVEQAIRMVDPVVPYRAVTARLGKSLRAEPVAALYEQGRIKHVRGLNRLEEQMCRMTMQGYAGKGSPDRVDALVWALTELILEPMGWRDPKVRAL
jgi:phage terminase large subunit-like protein